MNRVREFTQVLLSPLQSVDEEAGRTVGRRREGEVEGHGVLVVLFLEKNPFNWRVTIEHFQLFDGHIGDVLLEFFV